VLWAFLPTMTKLYWFSKTHDCPFMQKYVLLTPVNVARILMSNLLDQQSNLTFICTVTLVTPEVMWFRCTVTLVISEVMWFRCTVTLVTPEVMWFRCTVTLVTPEVMWCRCTVILVTSEVSFFIDVTSQYLYQHTTYSYHIFHISVWY
jgi:hypothetical protein